MKNEANAPVREPMNKKCYRVTQNCGKLMFLY